MKKLLSLVLALLMIVSIVPALADEDVVTFSYLPLWNGVTSADVDDEPWAEQVVEEAVGGIEIDLVVEDWNNDDAMKTLVFGGDLPNFSWLSRSYTIANMYEQELVRTWPVDMFREYAPSWAKLYDENPILWACTLDKDDPTQLLALSDFYQQTESFLWCWYIRYDWLVASGVDVSDMGIKQVSDDGLLYVAEKGIDKEDFVAFLEYCVNGDPDGDGADNTFGYLKDFTKLLSGFGINAGIIYDEADGQAKNYWATEQYKEFLLWCQDLYSRGLLYKEIFTIQWGEDWDMITNGMAGVHGSAASNWLNTWANSRPPVTLMEKGIPVVVLPGLAGDDGVTIRYASPSGGSQNWMYASAETTDEQMIAYLRMAEVAHFGNGDTANTVPWVYGEEGVDFEYDENGVPQALDSFTTETQNRKALNVFSGQIQMGKTWEWSNLAPGSWYEQASDYFLNPEKWRVGNTYDVVKDLSLATDADVIAAEYSADWSEIHGAYMQGVIKGQLNTESDWDDYMKKLNDSEYESYVAELNKLEDLETQIANAAAYVE